MPRQLQRVAVLGSSGSGKTTTGRMLAVTLGVPFIELDALNWGPDWTEATPDELQALVGPIVETEAWVIDGAYRGKLGDLVLRGAELVVWLDLPVRSWLPRLVRRTVTRLVRREEFLNGNRETVRTLAGRDSLILYALRTHRRRRREFPGALAPFDVVRLRSQAEIDRFLRDVRVAL